jgi:uncharacterized protein
MTSFSLRRLRLRAGEEYRDAVEIAVEPFVLGGQRYLVVPRNVPSELRISRATTGTVFELRFAARIHGPCFRCLSDAALDVPIDAREYHAATPGESEELTTPYVVDNRLDLSAWARDALALALPEQILCRSDCAGLCPVCGQDLNREPHEHVETEPDPRWAALEQLRDRL